MATSSISGLASGLDTASIIDQLMQLEALPQYRLKTQQSTQKSILTALRALNTDTSVLASKAEALAKASTWQTVQGTVTGAAGVTVKVGATATSQNFSVTVDQLASRHQLGFADSAAMSDVVVAGAGVKLTTNDGTVHNLATGGGTLNELVAAINAKTGETGVAATAVKVADGSYRLLAQSTATGANSSFTLTNADDSPLLGDATVHVGTDAQVSLGLGITATSSTNTFTGLVPGVDLTLDPATATVGSSSTITVAQNSDSVSASVKALVDNLNAMLTSIDNQTATKTATTAAGVLSGNSHARAVRSELLDSVFGSTGQASMATVGLQTDRYGKLVFDEAKFKDAYAKDPAGVAAMFTSGATTATDGFAARVNTATKQVTDRKYGILTSAIAGRDAAISRMDKSIEAWDDRLELRRTTLKRQYTALETALSGMQNQSSWLAGQINSLPSYNS